MSRPHYKYLYEAARAELAVMRETEAILIDENESIARRIQMYRNSAKYEEEQARKYRDELFELMLKCWHIGDEYLTDYCNNLENKYFDGFYVDDEEEGDANALCTERTSKDSSAIPQKP